MEQWQNRKDVYPEGGSFGGVVYTKYSWDVLDKLWGQPEKAWQQLSATGFPSYGYWTEELNATTLFEEWNSTNPDLQPAGESHNHIMFSGFSKWLFERVGGLGRESNVDMLHIPGTAGDVAPPKSWSQRSWRTLVFDPLARVDPERLSSGAASVRTPMGLASSSWMYSGNTNNSRNNSGNSSFGPAFLCGETTQGSSLSFECEGDPGNNSGNKSGNKFDGMASGQPAVFSGVDFASYGHPGGSCDSGFVVDKACDAPNSTAVIAGLCVGRSVCSVFASQEVFGSIPCR